MSLPLQLSQTAEKRFFTSWTLRNNFLSRKFIYLYPSNMRTIDELGEAECRYRIVTSSSFGGAPNDDQQPGWVQDVLGQLQRINQTLNGHTETLNRHTKILNGHTEILNGHTETLNGHTKTFNRHTETLNGHTEILNGHTEILNRHTELHFQKLPLLVDIYTAQLTLAGDLRSREQLLQAMANNLQTVTNLLQNNTDTGAQGRDGAAEYSQPEPELTDADDT